MIALFCASEGKNWFREHFEATTYVCVCVCVCVESEQQEFLPECT